MKKISPTILLPAIIPALLIFIWIYMAHVVNNEVILPQFQGVMELLSHPSVELISMGSIISNVLVSLARVLTGYILAVILAIPLGILMGYYDDVFKLFNTFLGLLRPIPPLAWVPLVLAWFGVASFATMLGFEKGQMYIYLSNLKLSMIFIIFIGSLFPVLTSSIYGVTTVRKTLIDSTKVLGASQADIFRKVILPAAAPSIVNGMRTGLGVGWMCLVSAEMLPGSISGIGYMITHAYTLARTDIVIAGMISIGAVGAALDYIFRRLEERKFKWQYLAR